MRCLGFRPNWPAVTGVMALSAALYIIIAIFLSGTAAAETRYLSDMNWTSATNGWGPAEKNMSNGEQAAGDGRTITLNGTAFQKGLGVHAASDVRYNLAGAYSTFSAKVGVDDEVGTRGSVVFEVWADGAKLYSSGVMNGASNTKDVLLDIRGKNELRLVVTNASDGFDFDHADWAEAMVNDSLPSPPPTGACNKGQFFAEYRNELRTFSTQPVLTRCETAVNNDWGSGSPGSGVNSDSFTTRWAGNFDFESSGYEFTATADDGVRLWVDGQLLIDQWKDQAATTYKATKTMTAGAHEIKVEYYENAGAASAKVSWAKVAQTPQPPPSGTDPPNVCAHWHVAAQREVSGANTVDAYVAELQKANAMGVECFAINVNGWDSNYRFHTNLLWDAANSWNNAHPNEKIYLYPSIDMSSIQSEATFEAISRHKYDDPARLRVDGGVHGNNLPVTQTWLGNSLFGGASGWDRILDEEANAGKPVFFMPYFNGTTSSVVDAYNGANNTNPADDVIDGLYNFGGLSSGDNSESGYQKNQALVQAVTPGMDAQVGCAPHFNRHSDSGQFGNRIIGDFEGFHAFNKCMYGYAAEQKPRFMEFTTWNDYLEGSYLGGPYTQAQLPSRYDGNYLSHDAFRKLGRYYIDWYESGVQPTISKDFVAIAHRPHAENALAVSGSIDSIGLPRQTDYAVVDDRLYAVVMLKSPGEVRLTSGGTSQTFSQPAGVNEVSMPFAAGTQKIELVRNGATQLSATSAIQITLGLVTLFNYNVATTYAEGP
ncbi:hypothetical protein BH18ACT11_BH18ACT11_00850 [soil metagenome]